MITAVDMFAGMGELVNRRPRCGNRGSMGSQPLAVSRQMACCQSSADSARLPRFAPDPLGAGTET